MPVSFTELFWWAQLVLLLVLIPLCIMFTKRSSLPKWSPIRTADRSLWLIPNPKAGRQDAVEQVFLLVAIGLWGCLAVVGLVSEWRTWLEEIVLALLLFHLVWAGALVLLGTSKR